MRFLCGNWKKKIVLYTLMIPVGETYRFISKKHLQIYEGKVFYLESQVTKQNMKYLKLNTSHKYLFSPSQWFQCYASLHCDEYRHQRPWNVCNTSKPLYRIIVSITFEIPTRNHAKYTWRLNTSAYIYKARYIGSLSIIQM